LFAGVLNVITAWPLLATATTFVGADGTLNGITELLALDEALVPIPLVAVTVNVYVTPFVSPVIVIGDEPPVALNPPTFDVTV
jgi:hypothetical protein